MLPCKSCAYRRNVPGDTHIKCVFAFHKSNLTPYAPQKWFDFPLNYDPVWGPDSCVAYSETVIENMVATEAEILMAFLIGRCLV